MGDQLTGRQVRALRCRATFNGPARDRFAKGVRDASAALAKILDAHPNDEGGELRNALRAYLTEGPAWDSSDYQDGGACVHDDVAAVLDGDREVIGALLARDEPVSSAWAVWSLSEPGRLLYVTTYDTGPAPESRVRADLTAERDMSDLGRIEPVSLERAEELRQQAAKEQQR